jgi:hypothetical protein
VGYSKKDCGEATFFSAPNWRFKIRCVYMNDQTNWKKDFSPHSSAQLAGEHGIRNNLRAEAATKCMFGMYCE